MFTDKGPKMKYLKKIIPCEHKGECTHLKGKGSCEFHHSCDDMDKNLNEYFMACYEFFTDYYANVLKKEIHHKFRQVLCTNPNHEHNKVGGQKWHLHKKCPFAHCQEEADFYTKMNN